MVFVPQLTVSVSIITSGLYRNDRISGLSTSGVLYQVVWAEASNYQHSTATLSSYAQQFLKILNDARKACCDPQLNYLLNVMNTDYFKIFEGFKNNLHS
jgi:hypothetical protein